MNKWIGGSEVAAQYIVYWETAAKPDDPTKEGWRFDGWYQVMDEQGTLAETAFDFENTRILEDITLRAVFTKITFGTPDFVMPTALTTIEESAFEGDTEISVVDASNVATIGKWAFKDCTGLTQIKLSQHCSIDASAFSGCGTVYVYAPAGGSTQEYCGKTTNPCVFVEKKETDDTLSSLTGQEGPVYQFPSGSTLPSILP